MQAESRAYLLNSVGASLDYYLEDREDSSQPGYTSSEVFSILESDLITYLVTPDELREELRRSKREDLLPLVQRIMPFFAVNYAMKGNCPGCGSSFTVHRANPADTDHDSLVPERYRLDAHGVAEYRGPFGDRHQYAVELSDERSLHVCAGGESVPIEVEASYIGLKPEGITLPHNY